MDRLKQEWKETRIPEEVYLRARNLAWAKIQHPTPVRPRLIWGAAASALVVVTAIIWIWNARETRIDQTSARTRPDVSVTAKTTTQNAALQAEKPAEPSTKSVSEQAAQMKARRSPRRRNAPVAQAREPERLVLNFTLPKTGARMIWIIDSSFHFDGGVK